MNGRGCRWAHGLKDCLAAQLGAADGAWRSGRRANETKDSGDSLIQRL